MFNLVHRNVFNDQLRFMHNHFNDIRDNVVDNVPNEVACYLSEDSLSGFGIAPDGEIVGVFAKGNVRGKDCIKAAALIGGKHLNCFDGRLSQYYSKRGFKVYKREPNWTQGQPDVVYMSL